MQISDVSVCRFVRLDIDPESVPYFAIALLPGAVAASIPEATEPVRGAGEVVGQHLVVPSVPGTAPVPAVGGTTPEAEPAPDASSTPQQRPAPLNASWRVPSAMFPRSQCWCWLTPWRGQCPA